MDPVAGTGERLHALVETGIALTSELSLDALLEKLAEAARALTGARYAALGVIDRSGRELERFVTAGVDEETRRRIGELPRGRGILGVLIREQRVLRLHDLTQDPRSVGFPPYHPPMHSFLGVPIMLRGVAYGNLYLTEKQGDGDFDDDDEEVVKLLAAQAAVAIENARLYESATRWLRDLESLTEIGNALVSELEPQRVLELVAQRLRELIGARRVFVALAGPGGTLRVDVVSGDLDDALLGAELSETSKTARVLARRRSERVDSLLDDPEVDQAFVRSVGGVSGLFVPLVVRDRSIGVLAANDKDGPANAFSEDDLRLAEAFAARAAIAVDLSRRVSRDALRRVVAAQELERRRIARELHDETGQALTSVLLSLRGVDNAKTMEEAKEAAAALRELVVNAVQDVRRLAVELRPKALDDFGLVPAVERLAEGIAEQSGIVVEVQAHLGEARLTDEVESALYRIVQEALTNVVKHAEARRVSVVLVRKPGSVAAVVEDDGRGLPERPEGEGMGILGMEERLALIDGRLSLESAPGQGTTVVAEVPL